jgi:hypothetical protein
LLLIALLGNEQTLRMLISLPISKFKRAFGITI